MRLAVQPVAVVVAVGRSIVAAAAAIAGHSEAGFVVG